MKKEAITGTLLEKHYELCYNAHRNVSFTPDRRAVQYVTGYSEQLAQDLETVKAHGGDAERYREGYERRFVAWMQAKSNCLSSMITGPSKFPTRRAEKANRTEHNRFEEFYNWRNKILKKTTRPESTDIVKGTEGAIEKLEDKLQKLEREQMRMKETNAILRSKKTSEAEKSLLLEELGYSAKNVSILMQPPRYSYERRGFQKYMLTNNGATIRRLRQEIESELARLEKYTDGNKETERNGVQVIENVEENRLQLIFDGKPEEETRAELKKNGFRWSPRFGAWQRQLTNNALASLERLQCLK